MKVKALLSAVVLLFLFDVSYAQTNKLFDDIDRDQVYLSWHKRSVKFSDLNEKTITALLGKPTRIRKDRSEHPNVSAITYTYPEGEINTEPGLTGFKITKAGWDLSFKVNNKQSAAFTVGSKADELKKLFPLSVKNSQRNNSSNLSVGIKKCDCGIAFILTGNKITAMYFSTNDD